MARTPEQQAAALADVQKMFDGGTPEPKPTFAEPVIEAKPAEVIETAPVVEAKPAEVKPSETVEAKPDDESKPKRRPVPYDRFAEVNAEAKQAKAEREQATAERDELRAKLAAMQATPEPNKHWLDGILDDGAKPEPETKPAPELSAFEQRVARLEERESRALLNETLSQMKVDYPGVPEEVLLSGLAAGKSAEDIAGDWDPAFEHIGQMYVKQHGYQKTAPAAEVAKPKPDAMPRLTGAPAPLRQEPEKNKHPIGSPQHKAAAIAWMQQHGF